MSTESRFCDRCGETLSSPESRFCSACGSSQSQGNDEAVETSTVSTVPTRSQYKAIKPTATRWFRMPHWILVIVGSVALVVGVGSLSGATEGVGLIAVACFLGIVARIAQAEWHEREAKRDMGED